MFPEHKFWFLIVFYLFILMDFVCLISRVRFSIEGEGEVLPLFT